MSATAAIPSPNPTSAAYSEYIDSQSFNVTSIDGTPLTVSFDELNSFINSVATQQAVYAFGVGFCGMLTVVLLLLTDRKKLRRPIYILNLTSLILYTFRSILQMITMCGVAGNFGEFFMGAQAQLTTAAYWPQITDYAINPFLYACIVSSLVLQVRVVFAAEPTTQKIVTGILFLGGVGIVVLEFIFCISAIVSYARDPLQDNSLIDTLFPIIKEYFVTYVGVSCLIFLYKLAITILRRRKMGIKKFGPLQIIFIMFSQCLVIPGIHFISIAHVSHFLRYRPLQRQLCHLFKFRRAWSSFPCMHPSTLSTLGFRRC
jgi:pheromone alpha factor receptor